MLYVRIPSPYIRALPNDCGWREKRSKPNPVKGL